MKAPRFWYRPLGLEAVALAPLSLLWRAGGAIRRTAATPYRAQKPLICVGNIVAGGAGKTPVALAIAELLQQQGATPVFVSRGYGGNLRGPVSVDPDRHSARDVGDEALLLACRAPTFIGRDRAAAIRAAEKHGSHIIMDDGLQNPHVRPDLSFLVIDGEAGFGNGLTIPAGPLRETLNAALTHVTAAIMIGRDEHNLTARIPKPLIHASWQADLPPDFPRDGNFFAFAGIGRPEKFYDTCRTAGLNIVATRDFPDHYFFSDKDLAALARAAEEKNARLITTAKDWVRLSPHHRMNTRVFPANLVFENKGGLQSFLRSA